MDEHDKRAREWYAQELNEQPPDCACYEQHIESLVTLLRSTAAAAVAAERERCAKVCDDEAVEAGRGRPNTVGCARMLAARIRSAPAQAEQRVSEVERERHALRRAIDGALTWAPTRPGETPDEARARAVREAVPAERSRTAARLRARADEEDEASKRLHCAEGLHAASVLRSEADALEQGE